MKKELQMQLDGLKVLGLTEETIEYKGLEAALKEADRVTETHWNDEELHEKMRDAAVQVARAIDHGEKSL